MKNLLRISSAMLLVSFLFTACDKDKDETPEKNEVKPITQSEMQNSKNPYDEQGTMYFDFLTELAENKDIGGWDVGQLAEANGKEDWDVGQIAQSEPKNGWDVSKVSSLAMTFNKSKGKDSGDKAQRSLTTQIKEISNLKIITPKNECEVYPERCKYYLEALEALNDSDDGTVHDRTIKFIKFLINGDAEIQENDKMNKEEKKNDLILSSIARYAAGYWFNETLKSDQPNSEVVINMIQLSTLGASTSFKATESEDVGVGTAILNAYVASGRASKK